MRQTCVQGTGCDTEQPASDRNLGENRCHQNQGNSQGRPPGCLGQPDQQNHLGAEQNQQDRSRPVFVQQLADRQLCERGDAKTSPVAAPIRARSPAAAINRSSKNFGKEIVMTLKTSPPNSAATQMTLNTTTWVRTLPLASTFFWGGASALDRKLARR